MAKRNFNRKQSSSLVPRFTTLSESEHQEFLFSRIGKAEYYKRVGRALKEEKLATRGDYWERRVRLQKEAEEAEKRQRIKDRRLALIAKAAEKV